MTRNQEIANTILQQLGGNMFLMMTGAKQLVAIDNGLRFRIGRNGSKANMVKIVLNGNDTYDMQFVKIGAEVNPYKIMMRHAEKGLTDAEFNAIVQADIERAKRNAELKVLQEYNDVYCDQLADLFSNYTKMNTRLF